MADDPQPDDGVAPPEDVDLRVPASATDEEAAAIAAAVGAYLADERAAAGADDERERTWHGRRWRLAARIEGLTGRPGRVPSGGPASGWRAAGRADRFRGR